VAIFKRGLAHLTSILGRLPVLVSGKIPVDVSFPATQPVSGTVTATGTVTANAGTGRFPVSDNDSSLTVDGTVTANAGTGTFAVSAASVPLPTGLTLASTRLLVDGSGVTQPVSGTITANAGTGPFPVSDNGSSLTVDGSVSVSNFPATQPVSGTVTANVTFPETQNVSVQNASIPVTDNGSSLTVDGTVSVSNFPATQPVSGTVTANAGTGIFAVSATALPLPTGAASESTLSTLNGKVPASLTVSASRLLVDGSGVTQPITGQSVAFSEVTGTAPAASTEVLGANAARRFLLIQNLSTAPFHISFGGIASTSTLRIDGGATLVFEGLVMPNQNIRMIQTQSNQGYYIAHN
jgi:hypothetical protein